MSFRVFTLIVSAEIFYFNKCLASNIIFPQIDDFPLECNLPDGSTGTCRNLKYCPTAITAKNITVCYYEQFEQFVCCRNNIWSDVTNRPITRACEGEMPASTPFLKGRGIGVQIPYVLRGLRTYLGEFSYMAALGWDMMFDENQYEYKCGGVLISHKYILTAAHCGVSNGAPPAVALLGGSNLNDSSVKPAKIDQVLLYPGYKVNESYHDIALIKLKDSVLGSDPICLWGTYTLDDVNVTAIGYGHTQFDMNTITLKLYPNTWKQMVNPAAYLSRKGQKISVGQAKKSLSALKNRLTTKEENLAQKDEAYDQMRYEHLPYIFLAEHMELSLTAEFLKKAAKRIPIKREQRVSATEKIDNIVEHTELNI